MSHRSSVHVTYFLSCLLSLSLEDDREWSRFRGNEMGLFSTKGGNTENC